MSKTHEAEANVVDHQMAFGELSFLIDIFASTIDQIMGGATAPVGRIAGRDMARKLPGQVPQTSLPMVVSDLARRMQGGFEFQLTGTADELELQFQRCVFRDVCATRGLELGGSVCKLFHSYLDGQLNELLSRPVKSELVACGDTCRASVRTQ